MFPNDYERIKHIYEKCENKKILQSFQTVGGETGKCSHAIQHGNRRDNKEANRRVRESITKNYGICLRHSYMETK